MTALILTIIGVLAVGSGLVVWCCLRLGAVSGRDWDGLDQAESVSEVNAQERDAAKRRHPSARGRRRRL